MGFVCLLKTANGSLEKSLCMDRLEVIPDAGLMSHWQVWRCWSLEGLATVDMT